MLIIKTVEKIVYSLPSAIFASTLFLTQSLSCDLFNCLDAEEFLFKDKLAGTNLQGQSKDYSKGALQSVNYISDFVPTLAIIPAATSILSNNAALASSVINVCATLVPLYGGLYTAEINMKHIAWKMGVSTLMVGATVSSIYSWMTFPDASHSSGTVINGSSNGAFQASYTSNVVLTGTVAAANIGRTLIMYFCRGSGENTPINRKNHSSGYGSTDYPERVVE